MANDVRAVGNNNPFYVDPFQHSSMHSSESDGSQPVKTPNDKPTNVLAKEVVVLEKTSKLKPALKSFGLFLLSFPAAFVPSLHNKIEFKRRHISYNMKRAWYQTSYQGNIRGVARNISVNEKNISKKEKAETKAMAKRCEELMKAEPEEFSEVRFRNTKKFKPLDLEGICNGIVTYSAQELLKGRSIESLTQELEKGAPPKAAASQHIYVSLANKPKNLNAVISNFFDHVKVLSNTPGNEKLNNASAEAAELALFMTDPAFHNEIKERWPTERLNELDSSQDENTKIAKEFALMIANNFTREERREGIKIDPQDLQKKTNARINQKFTSNVKKLNEQLEDGKITLEEFKAKINKEVRIRDVHSNSLKLLISATEFKSAVPDVGKKPAEFTSALKAVSDPLHRELLNSFFSGDRNFERKRTGGLVNGLIYSPVEEIMGNSRLMKNDETFLSNIKDLPAGVYGITISVSSGSHAILYRKNEDGSGDIIDPNGPILFCPPKNNDSEVEPAAELLGKLIGGYSETKDRSILAGPNDKHHAIEFYRIDIRAQDSSS